MFRRSIYVKNLRVDMEVMTRILVVSSDARVASALVELGYEVVATVTRAADAVRLAGELAPELVIVDPDLGVDTLTLERMAATAPLAHLPQPWTSVQLRAVMEVARANHIAGAAREERIATLEGELKALSYAISHDLRAPLRAVDGFSQAFIEDHGASLAPEALELLQRVRDGMQQMRRLLDGLLRLSRVSASALRRGRVNLSVLARVAALELQAAQQERSADVVIADDVIVEGDEDLLRIVLESLIGNAWKFTAKTARPRIEVGTVEVDGERACFVRDNGVGYDPRYSDKLFEAFQRLHAADAYEGIGLGLAVVKRIIDRHGGRVWAEGAVGQGATFYFKLPGIP